MKVWSTRWAMTKGVLEHEALATIQPGFLSINEGDDYLCGEGREWHRTREAAVARAEQMRKEAIESLREQINRLESLRFDG